MTTVDFNQVTQASTVQVVAFDPEPANLNVPGQFSIDGATAVDISTTAAFAGPIDVCFNMSAVTNEDAFNALSILHGEGGAWQPYPTSHDFDSGLICATVSSLSPFVVASLATAYQTQALFDATRAFKAGSTAPIKVRLLADGANVSSPSILVRTKRLRQVSSNSNLSVQDAGNANPDSNFRFDSGLNGYIFNLKTTGLASGTYELLFSAAGDPSYHRVQFQIR